MKKETAKSINALMLDIGSRLDESVMLVKNTCSDDEFRAYRKAIGIIMGTMLIDVMNPIYEEHKSLKPKELGNNP